MKYLTLFEKEQEYNLKKFNPTEPMTLPNVSYITENEKVCCTQEIPSYVWAKVELRDNMGIGEIQIVGNDSIHSEFGDVVYAGGKPIFVSSIPSNNWYTIYDNSNFTWDYPHSNELVLPCPHGIMSEVFNDWSSVQILDFRNMTQTYNIIGVSVMSNCYSLKTVYFPKQPLQINGRIIGDGCTSLTDIYFYNSINVKLSVDRDYGLFPEDYGITLTVHYPKEYAASYQELIDYCTNNYSYITWEQF